MISLLHLSPNVITSLEILPSPSRYPTNPPSPYLRPAVPHPAILPCNAPASFSWSIHSFAFTSQYTLLIYPRSSGITCSCSHILTIHSMSPVISPGATHRNTSPVSFPTAVTFSHHHPSSLPGTITRHHHPSTSPPQCSVVRPSTARSELS